MEEILLGNFVSLSFSGYFDLFLHKSNNKLRGGGEEINLNIEKINFRGMES